MSRTLFWYILKELLKIFLMTSGVLAGILSFCGLLKPLTEHGLDASQVVTMLGYFMPATQTYSLPLAALFATAVVYGRLSADNEITACRASGISYLSLAAPALVLGLTMAIISLLGLCFVVPHYTLKVEKVVFSNLAALVQNNIQRTHQLKLGEATVYAQSARVVEPDPARPKDQRVVLGGVMFVQYEADKADPKLRIPRDFYMAEGCTVYIHPGEDQVTVSAMLQGGMKVPRDMKGGTAAAMDAAQFGPVPMDSPIRENTKFMDIAQLKAMLIEPGDSKRVRKLLAVMIQKEQELRFRQSIVNELLRQRIYQIADPQKGPFVLSWDSNVEPTLQKQDVILSSREGTGLRQIKLESADAQHPMADRAQQVRVRVQADNEAETMLLDIELFRVESDQPNGQVRHDSFVRNFSVPMPAELKALSGRRAEDYIEAKQGPELNAVTREERSELKRNLLRLTQGIQSELHARVSFAISCLILVIMGCALGMMFQSGNFLTAFAVSAAPALISIALIVTGQHVGENNLGALKLGLCLIWSGNVVVFVLAIFLFWRLQRQ